MNEKIQKFVITIVAVLALTAVVIIALLQSRINNPQFQSVSVTGRGKVTVVPDTAIVNVGVNTYKSATAKDALEKTTSKINAIITAVKASGLVDSSDIQTTTYSLNPQIEYIDQASRVVGYSANQQVTVKIKAIDTNKSAIDAIIDLATKNGADTVGQVTFSSSKIEEYKQQARILAIADAKQKSNDTARAVGVELGDITGWWENYIEQPFSGMMADGKGGAGGSDMGGGSVAPGVQTGLLEVVIEMNLNYKIK